MKILILGGTKFLGRHLVDAARSKNHDITLFNRGQFSAEQIPGVESIRGDRHRDLDKLTGRSWDAVIDTSGYLPQSVGMSAAALADSVGRYIFVSSISAYASFERENYDETAPVAQLTDEQKAQVEKIDLTGDITAPVLGEAYGALKAECEKAAENVMPGRAVKVRSGLIVGRFDWTDRFTYWVMRTASGGEVLAPGRPERFVQMIDARDLAEWIVNAAHTGLFGTFNVTGRPFELTMGAMLNEIDAATDGEATFTWVPADFLEREGVQAWNEMPLYLPETDDSARGFQSANIDKALAAGLNFRPFADTVRETHAWRASEKFEMRAGIDRAREQELLRKWHEQKG